MDGRGGTGGQDTDIGTYSTRVVQPANAKKRAANAALLAFLKIVPLACVHILLNTGAFLLRLRRCPPCALCLLLQTVSDRLQPRCLTLGKLFTQRRIAPASQCQQHHQHGDHV